MNWNNIMHSTNHFNLYIFITMLYYIIIILFYFLVKLKFEKFCEQLTYTLLCLAHSKYSHQISVVPISMITV